MTVGACLWWAAGCLGARRGSIETGPSHREARLSILFVLPAQAIEGEAVHNGASSSGATSDASVADQPVKCRTLLDEVIECPTVSGEPMELETVVDESVNSETVSDESGISDATKYNDSEIINNSKTKPSTVLTNRDDGKRQFFGQNNNRLGNGGSGGNAFNRPGSNQGVSNRITGSNPQAAVSMVQSFVEDMITKPSGDRPGYIMINSRNPAIIQQLVATLTRRYGSASVIQDTNAIQNLSGDSRIQTLDTSSSAASSDMPVFPFETKWKGGSSSEPSTATVDPEVDYIRQQLSSIAHITVSTGQLVNDTLADPLTGTASDKPTPARTPNMTDDATVTPSAPATTQATEDHHLTYVHTKQNYQHQDVQNTVPKETISSSSAEELRYLNQQFSSRDSSPAPEGQITFKVDGQRVEDVNEFEPLQNEGREKDNSKTSKTNSTNGKEAGISDNTSHSNVTLPDNPQEESENVTKNHAEHEYARPFLTDDNDSIDSSTLKDNNLPDIITRPTNGNITVTESDLGINETTNLMLVSNNNISTKETSNVKSIFDGDSGSGSEGTSENSDNVTSVLENEVSTTGYEDYYEEIDGELVLSPTKFMRKGSPMVTSDYISDEDYYQVDGSGLPRAQQDSSQLGWNQPVGAQQDGHQTGGSQPVVPQHTVRNHLTGLASGDFASHGLAAPESANVVSPFPHNSNLMPNTAVGEAQEDINKDSSASQHTSSVLYKYKSPTGIPNVPLSAANSQPYPTAYSHMNPDTGIVGSDELLKYGGNIANENIHATKFTLNQEIGDKYIRPEIHPLYPNYNTLHAPRPSSADSEGYMNGPVQGSSGGKLPVNSQVLEQLWNIDKDLSQLALLEELDRIPVVYGNADLVTSAPILRVLPLEILDYLAGMEEGDLATLGLLDQMKTAAGSLNKFGDTAVQGFPGTDSSTQALHHSADQNTMSSGVSKELTSSQNDRVDHVKESKLEGPARSSFSSGNYRQSDVNIDDQLIQPVPPNFFPRRPTESAYPGSGQHGSHHGTSHHHGSGAHETGYQPQLTPEQEGIISRLPVGMQHVVSSIVLAVQAPSTTVTTTTTRPQQYPYPYPYPYPMYPYFPPPSYPYPFPPRHTDLSSSSDFTVQDVHGGHDVHSGHDSDGVHGDHGAHGHGAHTPHGDNSAHGGHGDHTAHGHGAHNAYGSQSAHGHGAHTSHEDPSAHDHGSHTSEVTLNDSPHRTHGNHGSQNSHGTKSSEFTPANHENTVQTKTHHDHSSHGHGHHGSQDSAQRDDLRGGVAGDDDATVTTNLPVTSNALLGTPRPAVPNGHGRIPLPGVPVAATFNPDAIGASRLGEFDATGLDDISETGIRDNNNKRGSITRIAPSQPDRNQGLLHLRHDPAQMGHGRPSGGGFVNYRPPQQTNMHMGGPVVSEVRPQATTSVPVPSEEETGPLIDPGEGEDDAAVTNAPQTMDREQVNSLLQSLFSSPTLLLLGIVFAASAAYMAIAMEEQAAQQNFQQAQLAAAFGGQPFPPGRRRRRRSIATFRPWYPQLPQLVDRSL